MKKKNAFTLIELLAVIVILAIIALISMPIIIGLIEGARKEAFKDSAYGIWKAAELTYSKAALKELSSDVSFTITNGVVTSSVPGRTLDFNGSVPNSGMVAIKKNGQIAIALFDGQRCAIKRFNENEVTVSNIPEEECTVIDYELAWVKTFGGSLNENINNVYEHSNNFIAVGTSSSIDFDLSGIGYGGVDFLLTSYDNDGNQLWLKTLGGALDEQYFNSLKTESGIYVVGATSSTTANIPGSGRGLRDAVIAKYDYDGNLLWVKSFGGTNDDFFRAVGETSDGSVIVTGYTLSFDGDLAGLPSWGNGDVVTIKYDTNGNEIWKKKFGGTGSDQSMSITVNDDDTFILTGSSTSNNNGLTNKGNSDGFIASFDAIGDQLNVKSFGGDGHESFHQIIVKDDGYIVAATTNSATGDLATIAKGSYDIVYVKYNTSFAQQWAKTIGGEASDQLNAIVDYDDGFYVFGFFQSLTGDFNGLNYGNSDAFVAKLDDSGNIVWLKNFGGEASDMPSSIAKDKNGNLFVAINSYSTTQDMVGLSKGGQDSLYMKLDANGNKLYSKSFGGTGNDQLKIYKFNHTTILAGQTSSSDGDIGTTLRGNGDIALIKIDSLGNFSN